MGKDVVILGVGMSDCGKFLERSLKDGARIAFDAVLSDAGINKEKIQAAYIGNVQSLSVSDQVLIRGEVWMASLGLAQGMPIINTESACATGHSALYLGYLDVASGEHDCVLVLGVEKIHTPDREKLLWWTGAARDMDEPPPELHYEEEAKSGTERKKIGGPAAMAGQKALKFMGKSGVTEQQLAKICVKNHFNASLNPNAVFQDVWTVEQVLTSRVVSAPIRVPMMANFCDGSAAVILCSADFARRYTTNPIYLSCVVLCKTLNYYDGAILDKAAKMAYERAGLGPSDIDVWELMDTSTMDEIENYSRFGICTLEETPGLIESGSTELTGPFPVNTSGGLEGRGHPAGATAMAQVAEQVWQLRGQAGRRQVTKKRLRAGLTNISGGGGPCVAIIRK